MTTMTGSDRREKIWSVIRVSSGNFLEMYDFFVFGYYATAIGRTFFPTGSEFAQLMLAFMTFGAGFLMRPLGGIFLGGWLRSVVGLSARAALLAARRDLCGLCARRSLHALRGPAARQKSRERRGTAELPSR